MTGDVAARWAGSVVPSWLYRWLLPAGWVVALVVSVASDNRPCSIEDPTICGPDRTFSLAMIACFGSLVLWWWRPVLAAIAGLLFLVPELRYDDVGGARVAWTAYAAACAGILVWILLSRRTQRILSAELPRRPVTVPAAGSIGVTLRLAVAAALVLVGAGALAVMQWQDDREQEHVRRSTEQTAVVKSRTGDGDVVLQLPDGSRRTVSVLDDYETGQSVPVLVDPADADWVRLRAELADNTFWYTVAGGAWVLAILLVLRDLRIRRARPRRTWSSEGFPVRIEPAASKGFAILSADGSVLLGFLDAEVDDEEADARLTAALDLLDDDEDEEFTPAALKREWEQTLQQYRSEALLVGELAEGSWPTVLLDDQVLRPVAPFRAVRRLPGRTEPGPDLPRHLGTDEPRHAARPNPGRPVDPAAELPTLPWEVPLEARPWWDRPLLFAVLVVTPIVVGALATWGEWITAIAVTVAAWRLIGFLGQRTFYRLIASATDLRVRSNHFEEVLPWGSVTAIEIDEDRLNLETADDWHVAGGIDEPELTRAAGVFETLRLRANTGLPAEPVGRRPAPGLAIEAGYLLVCALILVLMRWGPF